ncbi:MAG: hypothetical protein ABI824_10450, partial [Acidobacteriota bacterium]
MRMHGLVFAVAAAMAMTVAVVYPVGAQPPQGDRVQNPGAAAAKGGGKGGGRGAKGPAAPAAPTPRDANGKVIFGGEVAGKNGVWTPGIGINEAAAPIATVPFQPWAKAVYDERQVNELEPHTRCKASGVARQFMTPYGVEFVDLKELQRVFIFDIGGPHT